MRKKGKFLKKLLPVYASVMLGISFVCLLVYVAARIFPSFADALNGTVCHALRRAFAFVADAFPFSLAEVIILASPAVVLLIIFRASRVKDGKGRIRFISGLLSVISLFFSL